MKFQVAGSRFHSATWNLAFFLNVVDFEKRRGYSRGTHYPYTHETGCQAKDARSRETPGRPDSQAPHNGRRRPILRAYLRDGPGYARTLKAYPVCCAGESFTHLRAEETQLSG